MATVKKSSAGPPPEEPKGAWLVRERFDWYRDKYRQLVYITLYVSGAALTLSGLCLFLVFHRPHPIYFAATTDGRLIKLQPLNKPTVSDTALLDWAARSAIAPYNMDFNHWRAQLQRLSPRFTEQSWGGFVKAMTTNITPTVEKDRIIMSAVTDGAPVITKRGTLGGRLAEWAEIPIVVSYIVGEKTVNQHLLVKMVLVRADELKHPGGWAIQSFVPEDH